MPLTHQRGRGRRQRPRLGHEFNLYRMAFPSTLEYLLQNAVESDVAPFIWLEWSRNRAIDSSLQEFTCCALDELAELTSPALVLVL